MVTIPQGGNTDFRRLRRTYRVAGNHEDLVILEHDQRQLGGNQGAPRHRYYAFDKRSGARWMSTRRGSTTNTHRFPVLATIGGQRLASGGNAGRTLTRRPATGQKVELSSKRGINVSPWSDDAGRVFVSHARRTSRGTGRGWWRSTPAAATSRRPASCGAEPDKAGFPAPALHDGRVYVVRQQATPPAVTRATGDPFFGN